MGVDSQKQPLLNYIGQVVEKMINNELSALFYRRKTCKISFTFQIMYTFCLGCTDTCTAEFLKSCSNNK